MVGSSFPKPRALQATEPQSSTFCPQSGKERKERTSAEHTVMCPMRGQNIACATSIIPMTTFRGEEYDALDSNEKLVLRKT